MDEQEQLNLLNNLPGMAYRCLFHEQRTMLYVSSGCLALTGYTAGELTYAQGTSYGDLIHKEDRGAVGREIEAAVEAERPFYCIYRLVNQDKQERWVWEGGGGIYSEDGDLLYLEGFVSDANELMLAHKQSQHQAADQTRKLSALHGILEAVSTPAELPVVLKKSLKAALIAAQGDAGFIHLREKSGKTMRLVARQGITDSVAEAVSSVSTKDGLVAWVARNKEAMLIPNIGQDPRTVYLAARGDLKVYVGVPISRGHRVWGTLSVLGRDPALFGEEEVALLSSIGEEIGIIVENVRLRRQADRLLLVQERNRVARELHDSVTQSLYSLTLFAEAGRRTATGDKNNEAAEYFTQIGETGKQALKEMRLLVHRLRPSILASEGLVRALQQRLNSVEGRAGVKSQLIVTGDLNLSPAIEEALYHIAQEALNNGLKHAMASEVVVHLTIVDGEQVDLRIEDNGRGFEPHEAEISDGMGLTSMKERAQSFDGELTIQSTLGRGSIVEARLNCSSPPARKQTDFDVEDLP